MDTEKEQREMKTKKWTRAVPRDMISAGHKDSAQCELGRERGGGPHNRNFLFDPS